MSKSEAAAILKMIIAMYPNEYAKIEPESMKLIVEMWAGATEGYTGEQVAAAVQQYVASDTSGFAPKPGQVLKFITALDNDKDPTASEAWAMVERAIRNGSYGFLEEWEKLNQYPAIQRAIGDPQILRYWAGLPEDGMGVEESHFRRVYNAELERERERRQMPMKVRKALTGDDDDAMALPVGN